MLKSKGIKLENKSSKDLLPRFSFLIFTNVSRIRLLKKKKNKKNGKYKTRELSVIFSTYSIIII